VVGAILSPLSLHGGNRKTKLPLLHESKIHTPNGQFGLMPGDRTPLSLNESLDILTRVLRFEVSRRARIPSLSAEPSVLLQRA
jgi:hypothetical protein